MIRRGRERAAQPLFTREDGLLVCLSVAEIFAARGLVIDDTHPQWLRMAVGDIRAGKTVTVADIERYQNMGTTEA